jgi:hypothetical protein
VITGAFQKALDRLVNLKQNLEHLDTETMIADGTFATANAHLFLLRANRVAA